MNRLVWISMAAAVAAIALASAAQVWFAPHLALWLVAQAVWLAGPYLILRRVWPTWPWEKRLLALVVTATAGMCLVQQVVGSLGHLTFGVLMGTWAVLAGVGAIVASRLPQPPDVEPASADADPPPPAWHARVYLTVTLAMIGYYTFRAFVLAVEPVSDAPMYHLYFAARWLKAARLEIVPIPFGENAAGYFPSNAELVYLWWMLPFRADTLAKLGQLPFALAGAVAVFALSRQVGASRTAGTYAGASYLAVAPICAHAVVANVDLVMACFELTAIYFLLACTRRFRWSDWVLAGLAAGVFVGTKYIALTYAVLLVPLVLLVLARIERARGPAGGDPTASRPGRGAWFGRLVVFVLCALVAGGYWYLRNWVVTGNPLFPLHVQLGPWTILAGAYDRAAMLNHLHHIPVTDVPALGGMVASAFGGWYLVVGVWGWLLTAGAAWACRDDEPPRIRGARAWLWCLPAAHLVLYWLSIPYQNQFRFLYPATGLTLVWLAVAMPGRGWRRWPTLVLVWGAWLATAFVPVGPYRLSPHAAVWLVPLCPASGVGRIVCACWAVALGAVLFTRPGRRRRRVAAVIGAGLIAAWLGLAAGGVRTVPDATSPTAMVPIKSRQFAPAWLALEQLTGGDRVGP